MGVEIIISVIVFLPIMVAVVASKCGCCRMPAGNPPAYDPISLQEQVIKREEEKQSKLAIRVTRLKKGLEVKRLELASQLQAETLGTHRDDASSGERKLARAAPVMTEEREVQGRTVYGDAWDGVDGGVPLREIFSLTAVRSLKEEKVVRF
jgi:hypothetical protein